MEQSLSREEIVRETAKNHRNAEYVLRPLNENKKGFLAVIERLEKSFSISTKEVVNYMLGD